VSSVIRLRGARQNNLKGIDIDLPLGEMIVVTGPSGSGKSSLAFDTLYAEGQRRYVETFSPYTRQFLERMDKPKADLIDGIPPAIAIEQANHVRTTRSTVGTITEINDYLKLLFPRVARAFCPSCGREIRTETPASILASIVSSHPNETLLVTFGVPVPPKTKPVDFFDFLKQQGYLRVLLGGQPVRTDEPPGGITRLPAVVPIIQDRIEVTAANRSRLSEAIEAALRLGNGKIEFQNPQSAVRVPHSTGWHCPHCDLTIRPPSPGLFSFNNPLGACPDCRGFGRVIGIDWDRVMPDRSLSLAAGVVKPFQSGQSKENQRDLLRAAAANEIDVHTAFEDLPKADQKWVIEGDGGNPGEAWENGQWYGVKGFFNWLESRAYKMHVRVFLSRYRNYQPCTTCGGGRFQPETLNFRLEPSHLTLPEAAAAPIRDLHPAIESLKTADPSAILLRDQILSRLGYLETVGLGYLTLDRPTRTLSGGELERVNLTTCLGASLVNTLFVLDEPSVGLHPRDTGRLIEVLHALRDKGNTLIVVEHEEAVIRAANHIVDIGPGAGITGGELVFSGPAAQMGNSKFKIQNSLTAEYLRGEKEIPTPKKRRKPSGFISLRGIRHHNLRDVDAEVPLGVFCCVTGVSGSGKSSLVHDVIFRNLSGSLTGTTSDEHDAPGQCRSIRGDEEIDEVIVVDQSPLARSPRSTPAVYLGVYDVIRDLFGTLPGALTAGLSPSSFSFNTGNGRCERCAGLGFEKVEMQFLSDLFLRCPECEGKRFQPHVLGIRFEGKSIHDVLELSVTEALDFYRKHPRITGPLTVLAEVGLGYLRLGQPVNALSGGESQRLKLASHIASKRTERALLLFDEPTTGLHFDDVARLLRVLHRLVDDGHDVIVVEHNLEVIKNADWVIDLGPEAGDQGGRIVATGTPEAVAQVPESHTGRFLKEKFAKRNAKSGIEDPPAAHSKSNIQTPKSDAIRVVGAREHNLKNISLEIPRDKMVVVTGLSGSGKSTLAFDILFAEGQRRFLDSMSAYARQFVDQLEKPDVDAIEGLPPSVAIEQRVTRGGGKSTVATVTEIYHFLRLLFSKLGVQHCPDCNVPVEKQTLSAITTQVRDLAKRGSVEVFAPLVKARKGFHTRIAQWAQRHGIAFLLADGGLIPVSGFAKLERFKEHTIDALVARLGAQDDVAPAVRRALEFGKGSARIRDAKGKFHILSSEMNCPSCARAFEPLDPRQFSFNSPHGWCLHCRGYGEVWTPTNREFETAIEAELAEEKSHENLDEGESRPCPICQGARINETARAVRVQGHTITGIIGASSGESLETIRNLTFRGTAAEIAGDLLAEITQRLEFLAQVGLDYLSLGRAANTLSGGESQRIRLAAQLGSNLRGVLYVLDEPTIGLHARDNSRLIDALESLARKGNSLVIVEHDEETMRRADHIIDLGPRAGSHGGEIVAAGTLKEILKHKESLTAKHLRHPMAHPSRGSRRPLPPDDQWIELRNATLHNLNGVNVRFPLNCLSVVSGISGSGKSTLVRGVLLPAVRDALAPKSRKRPAAIHNPSSKIQNSLQGTDALAAVLEVDQSPIGKTSRSTPATYIKVFDAIRALYASLPAARMRGYSASRFSFNADGGRCDACAGQGVIKLEMNFLPPSYMPCQECNGRRYNATTLEVEYNGKSIGDVMDMTVEQAADFFSANPKVRRALDLLVETGLGYLKLGQPSPTLSGGEAQRIKLVTQLTRRATSAAEEIRTTRRGKSTLYILEEPTIGLHAHDVEQLISVLHRLVDEGGTVIVIEHHMDVIGEADHLIDIGPEAGTKGGKVVASGTPEDVAKCRISHTAPFLRKILK